MDVIDIHYDAWVDKKLFYFSKPRKLFLDPGIIIFILIVSDRHTRDSIF